MRRSAIKLRETLDREATDQELADELDLNLRRIRLYREAARALIWLDSPISGDDSTPLSETVADESAAVQTACSLFRSGVVHSVGQKPRP